MKGDAWEGGHRMPFIVRWPGKVKAGSVSDLLIGFTDVLATLAEATGNEIPEGAGPDSYSFLPELLGKQQKQENARPSLLMESASGAMLIRSGKWKLINQLGSGGFSKPRYIEPAPGDPEGQLYDLSVDPGETNNLYLQEEEVVSRLLDEIKQIVETGH
jgi:arylsulfatase A-like enzyme